MAPIHHHFEKMGFKETDIVKGFWVVGLILSMAAILFGAWIIKGYMIIIFFCIYKLV